MLVQVMCIITLGEQNWWALAEISRVRSAVLPPAPHVTSMNMGSSEDWRVKYLFERNPACL